MVINGDVNRRCFFKHIVKAPHFLLFLQKKERWQKNPYAMKFPNWANTV